MDIPNIIQRMIDDGSVVFNGEDLTIRWRSCFDIHSTEMKGALIATVYPSEMRIEFHGTFVKDKIHIQSLQWLIRKLGYTHNNEAYDPTD